MVSTNSSLKYLFLLIQKNTLCIDKLSKFEIIKLTRLSKIKNTLVCWVPLGKSQKPVQQKTCIFTKKQERHAFFVNHTPFDAVGKIGMIMSNFNVTEITFVKT